MVGGEDNVLRQLLNPRVVVGQHVDGVSIADDRTLCAAQLGYHGNTRLFRCTQSRTDAQRLKVLGLNSLREGRLLAVYLQYCLRDGGLQDAHVLLWRVDGELAGSAA